ncbi:MAG TPA: hypothetical protein VFV23_12925 [Verrucomicrobiae bacterium]|nr:hypothetical protein [Verrucomicrobiae bacterium]
MGETLQNTSNLNPAALSFLVVMSVVVLLARRSTAVKALLATAALVPLGQQLVVFGLHLHFLRLLLLVGFCRLLFRREAAGFTMTGLDKLFAAWLLVGLGCGILRGPSAETFGAAYNAAGTYFFIRILTHDSTDLIGHLRLLVFLAIVIGLFMCLEMKTHRNLFSILGGVPEITVQRGDQFRCQGPFRHPILAGTFGATLFPLLAGLWFHSRKKFLVLAGIAGSAIITIASASSGPLLTFLAALIGLALWPLSNHMHWVRRAMVAIVAGLALVMNAPVWFLIARVSDLVGGTGWYRSHLIDLTLRHFNEWWLIGTAETASWGQSGEILLVDPKSIDIVNHYVAQCVTGGIGMLGLFLATVVVGFKIIGRCIHSDFEPTLDRKIFWAIGVTLAAHCAAFISVSYFDQILVFWFWLLAVISSLSVGFKEFILSKNILATPAGDDGRAVSLASQTSC